ncbi:Long-chain-fatty-acid--CoA ligase (plasmid) [Variovorax sp. WDL1]|nr:MULTISPECIES: AMP-binding protein [unclassified Variovorax]PNG46054.1 3-[(3aS,4S,7aS)-7a-methyl-1,5-dioxo-octahydro-1H-inden-4-yl]propanoyl:CoA ligase [Variovorax sp. B2]PNG46288.1 3-[(3aS,4S,7aS)-7a-methyl-1,5-dioxo-octahydro-1H-inden-4-yl]propanoyl:CoA ligase [Variovorax sp. B4]VTV19158.1 Long-chain-fatty-acid--CoA ligase [Variovorax sp. WDL1]
MTNADLSAPQGYASCGTRRIDLVRLWHRGGSLAAALRGRGVGTDDAVAILMRNDLCFLEAMVAATLLGAYPVPINWHGTASEVAYILKDSGVKVLLAHADLYACVRDAVPTSVHPIVVAVPAELAHPYAVPCELWSVPPDVDDLALVIDSHEPLRDRSLVGSRGTIVYTSGTTGLPKGVKRFALPPDGARRFGEMSQQWFGLRGGVRTVMAGPMYHSAPNTYTLAVLRLGGSIALMPRFDPEALLALIEAERITHLHLVPTMFVRLLRLPEAVRSRYDLRSLEFVIHGAAPCSREVKSAMIDWWGPVIYEYYGATETGMVTRCSSEEWLAKPGTVGKAWPGREIRVYAEDGQRLGPGELGEIYVGMQGVPEFTYHNADQKRRSIELDGLVTNGDVGYLDSDEYLYLVDRKKDMVISGGVNIYPAEIESVLINHPAVFDCAVIGVPDSEYGENLAAYVIPSPGWRVDEAALQEWLRARLAGFKVPRLFFFADQLPRDDSGKLLKRKLREPHWAEHGLRI